MRCKNCGRKLMKDSKGWFHPEKAVNWDNKKKDCEEPEPDFNRSYAKRKKKFTVFATFYERVEFEVEATTAESAEKKFLKLVEAEGSPACEVDWLRQDFVDIQSIEEKKEDE